MNISKTKQSFHITLQFQASACMALSFDRKSNQNKFHSKLAMSLKQIALRNFKLVKEKRIENNHHNESDGKKLKTLEQDR